MPRPRIDGQKDVEYVINLNKGSTEDKFMKNHDNHETNNITRKIRSSCYFN